MCTSEVILGGDKSFSLVKFRVDSYVWVSKYEKLVGVVRPILSELLSSLPPLLKNFIYIEVYI